MKLFVFNVSTGTAATSIRLSWIGALEKRICNQICESFLEGVIFEGSKKARVIRNDKGEITSWKPISHCCHLFPKYLKWRRLTGYRFRGNGRHFFALPARIPQNKIDLHSIRTKEPNIWIFSGTGNPKKK